MHTRYSRINKLYHQTDRQVIELVNPFVRSMMIRLDFEFLHYSSTELPAA